MIKMTDMDKITIDELAGEQKEIAECIGIDSYKNLVENFGGTSLYIQKSDKMAKNSRDEQIKKKFNGYNHKMLAREFNLSESSIRKILNET